MKKAIALLIPALAFGVSTLATAGDAEKKKCPAEATVCIRNMADALRQRGWIGIEWGDEAERPVISHVVSGSPAAQAGVERGDIVMAFAGISTDEEEEVVWAAMKRSLVPGKTITLAVVRDGVALDLEVELVAVPEHIIAQWIGKHVIDHHAAAADAAPAPSP